MSCAQRQSARLVATGVYNLPTVSATFKLFTHTRPREVCRSLCGWTLCTWSLYNCSAAHSYSTPTALDIRCTRGDFQFHTRGVPLRKYSTTPYGSKYGLCTFPCRARAPGAGPAPTRASTRTGHRWRHDIYTYEITEKPPQLTRTESRLSRATLRLCSFPRLHDTRARSQRRPLAAGLAACSDDGAEAERRHERGR